MKNRTFIKIKLFFHAFGMFMSGRIGWGKLPSSQDIKQMDLLLDSEGKIV